MACCHMGLEAFRMEHVALEASRMEHEAFEASRMGPMVCHMEPLASGSMD